MVGGAEHELQKSEVGEGEPVGRKRVRLLNSVKTAVFVLGSFLVVFIAFRNTVTWHLQLVWGASGDLWQTLWEPVYDYYAGDQWSMAVNGTAIVSIGAFWLFNIFFICIDMLKPSWVQQYKIQENEKVSPARLAEAVGRALFNQVVVGYIGTILLYKLALWRGCNFGRELPTFPWVVYELFIFIWVEEIGFYYSHRLFHHPRLYKHVHKTHHLWTAPIGIVSIYAHPLEHFMSNMLPVGLGPIICGSHISTAWMWYCLALFSTTIAHCGYHFPFLPSPEAHDFHHLKFNQNYGVMGVLDRLHGTDSQFRASKAYDRHFMSLSLVPVKELYPEETKNKAN